MATRLRGQRGKSTDSETDGELAERCRNGDEWAFSQLYIRHQEAAERYAVSLCRSHHAAADAVAEAFARLLQLFNEGRGPEGEMRPYLLRMIRNLSYDEFRLTSRFQTTALDSTLTKRESGRHTPATLDELAEWSEDCAAALRALRSLPQRWQLVLWCVDVMGLPPRDLVDEFGTSAHNISALLYRAREGLRSAYLSEQAGPSRPTCRVHASRLGALVRSEVGPQEKRRLAAHLDWCPDCSSKLDLISEEARITKLVEFDDDEAVPVRKVA